jgi:glycosyltransferase involved in cell wall biosynthesis
LDPRVAILIPCYNEAATIGTVVRRFREAAPEAAIYVFDNSSTDETGAVARAAGAAVIVEPRRGKGHVVRSMFRKVDADVYVMVDGDDTYPADVVDTLVSPIRDGQADMVIGSRLHRSSRSDFRPLNRLGNRLFRSLLGWLFGVELSDLLSGYRSFSRRLVRAVPLFGGGFETETEMTIKALHRGFRIVEVPVDLSPRAPGSHSKLRLLHDGFLILTTILALFRDYKPLTFFGALGVTSILAGLVVGGSALSEAGSLTSPSALVAAVLVLTGVLSVAVGLVLHTVARHFQELEVRLELLTEEPPRQPPRPREAAGRLPDA